MDNLLSLDEFDSIVVDRAERLRLQRNAVERAYRERNKEAIKARRDTEEQRARHAANAKAQRHANLDEYRTSHNAQKAQRKIKSAGRQPSTECEICRQPSTDFSSRIVFDHCHKSNKFRGWICDKCNRILGFVADSTDYLANLARYLEKVSSVPEFTATELNFSTSVLFGGCSTYG